MWQFLMNPTHWTQSMFHMKNPILRTSRAPVWRLLTVKAMSKSMKRLNWQNSANSFVMCKKLHWQRRKSREKEKLTKISCRQLYDAENTNRWILLLRVICPFMSLWNGQKNEASLRRVGGKLWWWHGHCVLTLKQLSKQLGWHGNWEEVWTSCGCKVMQEPTACEAHHQVVPLAQALCEEEEESTGSEYENEGERKNGVHT